MRLLVKCPSCRLINQFALTEADKRKRCRQCGCLFKIPDTDQLAEALKIAEQAGSTVYVDQDGRIYG